MTLAPRQKLIGAALLALAVPVIAALQGASATNAARAVLAVAALAGIAAWFIRARGGLGVSKFKSAPRLTVIQRVGLAPRTGMALVEVDGRPYLVVHGDGYAKLTPARRAKAVSP
jgi:flagellar biogenesis protein FliO